MKQLLLACALSLVLISTLSAESTKTEVRADIASKRLIYVPGDVFLYEHEVNFPASTKIYKLAFSCEPFYKVDSWPDEKEAGKISAWAQKHGYSYGLNASANSEPYSYLWIGFGRDMFEYASDKEGKNIYMTKVERNHDYNNFAFLNAMSEFYGRTPVYYYKNKAGKLDVSRCRPEVDGRIYRFSGNGFRFPTQDEVIQEANIKNQMKKAVDFEDDSRGVHLNEYYKPETKIVCSAE